ncbi:alpha/beta hydrolase [Paenibacillus sp. CAU 1782]
MSLAQIGFYSACLKREVVFNALLPLDRPDIPGLKPKDGRPLKTLYLLHGYSGSHTDWLHFSRIRELADKHGIAVIMPAGENRFYLDNEDTEERMGEYIGKELVDFTREMFPLSKEREDTFIGGLSMGGYGAIRNGLKYGERFGAILGLSSALVPYEIAGIKPDFHNGIAGYGYFRSVFGDLDQVMGSDRDPEELVRGLRASGSEIPRIYMACGTEDFLLEYNRRFHQFLTNEGVSHTYIETPGAHTWDFWNEHIPGAINWALQPDSDMA